MMNPELSRWLAAVVSTPHLRDFKQLELRERFVEAGTRYASIADLPDDLRVIGEKALREHAALVRQQVGT